MNGERFEVLVVLTNSILKSIQRLKMQKMRNYGLTGAHMNCIYRLEQAGEAGLTQLELVQREMMDASQISRVLRELMDKGFVKVDGDEGRYRRHYALTEAGLVIAQDVHAMINEVNDFVMDGITLPERESFFKTLAHLSENLMKAEDYYLAEAEAENQ